MFPEKEASGGLHFQRRDAIIIPSRSEPGSMKKGAYAMKKRIFAGLLALCVAAVCLGGCGKTEGSIRGSVTQNKEPAQPETTVPETTAGPELSLGSTSGNRWENQFIGIGCELDENWTFMTDEEIRQQNQVSSDLVGDEYKEAMESANVIYDMMATHANQTDTVSVTMEKLSGAALLITEELYIEASKESLEGAIGSMGVENIQTSVEEADFAGESHYSILLEGEYSGVKIYEKLAVVKCNGYMACITVATWVENRTEEILDSFYGL